MKSCSHICLSLHFLLIAAISGNAELLPPDSSTLNRTQIQFLWQASNTCSEYILQAAENSGENPFGDSLVVDLETETNTIIVSTGFEWGNEYVWRWKLNQEDENNEWSDIFHFSVIELPDSLLNINIFNPDQDLVQPGLTIFDLYPTNAALAYDLRGNPVWYLTSDGYPWDVSFLPNGNVLFIDSNPGWIVESNLDGEEVFRSPGKTFHHEVMKLSDESYISLNQTKRIQPDPYGEGDSLIWIGDGIVEINLEGDTLFYWDTFDYISTDDFDSDEYASVRRGEEFDWTHGNACTYDALTKTIYFSARHLNRIVKIDYESGDIIWNLGSEFPSGDVDFGFELDMSYQHAPEILENGNIIIYDNHNLGEEDSSRVLEISVDPDREQPVYIEWEHWSRFKSGWGGDADRLENGNTLVTASGPNRIYEVNSDEEVLWSIRYRGIAGIYRARRISSLYPLVYSIDGPLAGDSIPANETYITIEFHNLGHDDQVINYFIQDENGWFESDTMNILVPGYTTESIVVEGFASDRIERDTLRIVAYPSSDPNYIREWSTVVISNPALTIERFAKPEQSSVLVKNYPNPFNNFTNFEITLNQPSTPNLIIFDIQGRQIRQLFPKQQIGRRINLVWDGRNESGKTIPNGVYFYHLKLGNRQVDGSLQYMK